MQKASDAVKILAKRYKEPRLMPGGIPKWVRCYDNGGETTDRYTVVFTGNFSGRDRRCHVLGMSGAPFHPQGVCLHGDYDHVIDRPRYGHLGKRIKFTDLPDDCQRAVIKDYRHLWGLPC